VLNKLAKNYILTLDQGTTSSRAMLVDREGKVCSLAQRELKQYFPKPGWVEHDPQEIWSSQFAVATEALTKIGVSPEEVAAIGIANQRETTVVWNRQTGDPIYPAIVWQDHRTAKRCDQLIEQGFRDVIKRKTGLEVDAYFSATKIQWILEHVPNALAMAETGELIFGNIDSWLIWKLTGGKVHATDVTNASRTMLFNIHTLTWDDELLQLFGIPILMMPEVKSNSEVFGYTAGRFIATPIPIAGVAGDQQAALFGQLCLKKGMLKSTYGTGCFIVMNTGEEALFSENKLITTIAWKMKNQVTYALEGSVFTGGAAVQWLRDGLGIIDRAADVEKLALSVIDNGGVYFVPAFTGLGAPYWKQQAQGLLFGISRGTQRGHIARAAMEAIALQSLDVMIAMERDTGIGIEQIRVDGGASANNLLMQYQSDLLQCKVERPENLETTALGAAFFAGLAVGFWENLGQIESNQKKFKLFTPKKSKDDMHPMVDQWHMVVKKSF
jgi:glycerol kinase